MWHERFQKWRPDETGKLVYFYAIWWHGIIIEKHDWTKKVWTNSNELGENLEKLICSDSSEHHCVFKDNDAPFPFLLIQRGHLWNEDLMTCFRREGEEERKIRVNFLLLLFSHMPRYHVLLQCVQSSISAYRSLVQSMAPALSHETFSNVSSQFIPTIFWYSSN